MNHFAASTPVLHEPVRLYAKYGVVLFAGLLLLGWWVARRGTATGIAGTRTMAAALWAPVGMLIAVGLNQPLSNGVHESRPYAVYPHALVLVAKSHDYSFPSDHAVMAGAVAAGLFLVNRRLGVVAIAAALLMAFARVYVGAHFPLDVIAGLFFGAIVSVASYLAVRAVIEPLVRGLSRTPLRPLLTQSPAGSA
jgi:undecaprenyl-diphosphatase